MAIALWHMRDVREQNTRVKERGEDIHDDCGQYRIEPVKWNNEEFRSYYGAVNSATLMETIRHVPEVITLQSQEEEDERACSEEDPFDSHINGIESKSEHSALLPNCSRKRSKRSPSKALSVASKASSAQSSIDHVCKMVF